MIITVEKAAKEYFNGLISKSKLYQLVRERKIPVIQLASRKIYLDTNALDKWIQDSIVYPADKEEQAYGTLRELKP